MCLRAVQSLEQQKHLKAFTVADLFGDDPILKASKNMDQNLANLKQKLSTDQTMLGPCSNVQHRLQLHRATG